MWVAVVIALLFVVPPMVLAAFPERPAPERVRVFASTYTVTADGIVNVWWSEGMATVYYQPRVQGRWGTVGTVRRNPGEYPVAAVHRVQV